MPSSWVEAEQFFTAMNHTGWQNSDLMSNDERSSVKHGAYATTSPADAHMFSTALPAVGVVMASSITATALRYQASGRRHDA